ncbi:Uncharacterized protein HZ326_23900 [Fusarium oxysporum f. sp. albedinis]|jgi:hypothetical protein|nr:Uncharacterized protein HZ326_23900 [Fusarium oxysporum f. sp. albedinis]
MLFEVLSSLRLFEFPYLLIRVCVGNILVQVIVKHDLRGLINTRTFSINRKPINPLIVWSLWQFLNLDRCEQVGGNYAHARPETR